MNLAPSFKSPRSPRRGMALVLFAVFLIPLIACIALAIDLGLLAAARTQVSDAADAAALGGARTLNGSSSNNNNYANVVPTMNTVMTNNRVLGTPLTAASLTTNIGRYVYNSANQRFEGQFPGPSTENWSLVQATVSTNANSLMSFSKIFNFTVPNIQVTSAAAHRPRDVAVILDYSGSMRFGSLVGLPYSGDRTTNNQDSVVPVFGHYSSGTSTMTAGSASPPYDDANISQTTSDGRAPIIGDFFTSASGGAAFTAASNTYASTPGGDNFLKTSKNAGSSYAQTLYQAANNTGYDAQFEATGYKQWTGATFQGYTLGPKYWGKTFWIWPPDPKNTNDWRQLYFNTTDNSDLYDSSGNCGAPGSSTYTINYTAILNFIKNKGANPFPSRLQSGRILYYDSIPSSISTSSWPPSDMNQRFWKDYIDYVLGVMATSTSNYTMICDGSTGYMGYGSDYSWGTVKITAQSSIAKVGGKTPYINYQDNPKRPILHFWFGPLSMIDFLGNYNLWYVASPDCSRYCWWPGTCHESPLYACKLGIRAALNDINNNHPNDLVSLIMFSTPKGSANDTSASRFNRVRVGLSRDYTSMQESLWYPPATVGSSNSTVRPYDANNLEVPRAMGGTCYSIGLMLAYNQFSANAGLKSYNPGAASGDAGGNGRKGAQKIVIFETDGAPNTTASANFNNSGSYNSYYSVRYNSANPGASEYPSSVNGYSDNASAVTTQIYSLCTQLAAKDSASQPGYSSAAKKLLIHCIGFGPVFSGSGSATSDAISTLNQMQTLGNVTDGMPSYKLVDGTESQIITKLQQAIAKILQDGVQVSLIQ